MFFKMMLAAEKEGWRSRKREGKEEEAAVYGMIEEERRKAACLKSEREGEGEKRKERREKREASMPGAGSKGKRWQEKEEKGEESEKRVGRCESGGQLPAALSAAQAHPSPKSNHL